MTRKRYIKLVMACGHNLNYAKARADMDVKKYGSYLMAWNSAYDLLIIFACKTITNSIADIFFGIWEEIKKIISAVNLDTGGEIEKSMEENRTNAKKRRPAP